MCSVAQSRLGQPHGWSPPGSSVHRILQARTLEWVAISSSGGASWPQGSNLHLLSLLHWQVDSLPGKPSITSITFCWPKQDTRNEPRDKGLGNRFNILQKYIYLFGRSSFLTRDWTWLLALGAWSLSHWTTREVPRLHILMGGAAKSATEGAWPWK